MGTYGERETRGGVTRGREPIRLAQQLQLAVDQFLEKQAGAT
jgi:hypothetical protein